MEDVIFALIVLVIAFVLTTAIYFKFLGGDK
jgi:hypothetical protein